MKKIVFSLLFALSLLPCFAQRGLLFTNKTTQKEILIREGDLVKFSYNGYIGQKEVKSGVVFSIKDSVIGLIAQVASGKINLGLTEIRYIYLKDITGFRKFHRSKPYLQAVSSVAITVGSILLFYSIDKHSDLTFAEKLGISVGTGLVTTMIVRAAFPERIRNKLGTDWKMELLK